MKLSIVKGIVLGLMLVVAIGATTWAVTGWVAGLVIRNCSSESLREYDEIEQVVHGQVSDARLETYNCGDGGYPLLHFTITGSREVILTDLDCVERTTRPEFVEYACHSPKRGTLELWPDGTGDYSIEH